MSVKGIRRMLVGEEMPDKNDPKYKERYEKEVAAGRKFAKTTRIDRAAAKVQGFANAHKTLFLVVVFGLLPPVSASISTGWCSTTVIERRRQVPLSGRKGAYGR